MIGLWFHFYVILKPNGKLCLRTPTSFFNELEIENELCSNIFVSFFNELDIEWELCSEHGFIFMQA